MNCDQLQKLANDPANFRKALIIPRTHPRKEQLIRAKRLSDLGLVSFITPEQLTPTLLFDKISDLLSDDEQPLEEARQRKVLPLDGANQLAARCISMLHPQLVVN